MNIANLFLTVSVLMLAGCANFPTISEIRQTASSGFVGCPPSEIEIADNEKLTWTASCKGKKFYCSATASVSCTLSM